MSLVQHRGPLPLAGHLACSTVTALPCHVLKYAGEPCRVRFDVDGGRADARVSRDLCDRLQVDAALGQPRDQCPPAAVRRRACNAGLDVKRLQKPSHRAGSHRAALLALEERRIRARRARYHPRLAIALEYAAQGWRRQEHVASAPALGVRCRKMNNSSHISVSVVDI